MSKSNTSALTPFSYKGFDVEYQSTPLGPYVLLDGDIQEPIPCPDGYPFDTRNLSLDELISGKNIVTFDSEQIVTFEGDQHVQF